MIARCRAKAWAFRCSLFAGLAAVGLSACQAPGLTEAGFVPSTSPMTVDTVMRGDRLANLARRQHPKIVGTYGGEYSNPKLERMLARVVGRLSLNPDSPSQSYQITILDSPTINAFALPGGYLYVTRGLLALANDSAEVAAVLAHEMAHVTANHGLERQRREAEVELTARVVNEVVSGNSNARTAAVRDKLRLAQFSRNQELEADVAGIRSISRAGYDPYAAARFLQSMTAYQRFSDVAGGANSDLNFLASHPSAPRRIELAQRNARQFGEPGTGVRDRDAFLAGIDGMLFGDKADQGYVRGRDFLHPTLGIAFSVPEGFTIDNSVGEVGAVGPGGITFRLDGTTVSKNVSLTDYLKGDWLGGVDTSTIHETTINGHDAAIARAQAGDWQVDVTVIRVGEQIYRLLTGAPQASQQQLDGTARAITSSFRVLNKAEIDALKPLRIRVVTVRPGETMATFANRMVGMDRKLELFQLLNGIGPGEALSAGQKVKIVTDR